MRKWRRASPATGLTGAGAGRPARNRWRSPRRFDAEARPGRAVLVDCLTLWLSNLMLAGREVEPEIARLAAAIGALAGPVALVSNEVGLGVVPERQLGRAFRDAQGRANAEIARACEAVVFVAAGLPTLLKPAPRPALTLR